MLNVATEPTDRRGMKTFTCGSVIPGCDARFIADTEDEILAQVRAHAAERHGIADVDTQTEQLVRSHITAVA